MILAFCLASIVVDLNFHVEYEAYELLGLTRSSSVQSAFVSAIYFHTWPGKVFESKPSYVG